MEVPSFRLLPYAVADGPHNMAADEVLLEAAVAGMASLRFYGWSPPTLSLGYFQPEQLRRADSQLASLSYVRRPTGGMTLVHHHELTYALALPAGAPWQAKQPASWLCRMHDIIRAALARLGISAEAANCALAPTTADLLCFRHITPGDLQIGEAKVVGSAQRKQRGALLQHGAILLARSPYTPSLPGILELFDRSLSVEEVRAAVLTEWTEQTGWRPVSSEWTAIERQRLEELVHTKYAYPSWNDKR
jgi:lipoate-protein ligase A